MQIDMQIANRVDAIPDRLADDIWYEQERAERGDEFGAIRGAINGLALLLPFYALLALGLVMLW